VAIHRIFGILSKVLLTGNFNIQLNSAATAASVYQPGRIEQKNCTVQSLRCEVDSRKKRFYNILIEQAEIKHLKTLYVSTTILQLHAIYESMNQRKKIGFQVSKSILPTD
jgi:hypothetical protein